MENTGYILPIVLSLVVIAMVAFIIVAAVLNNRKKSKDSKPKDPSRTSGGHDSHDHHDTSHHEEKTSFWGHVGRAVATLFALLLLVNLIFFGIRFFNWWDRPAVVKKAPEYPYSGTGRATQRDGVKAYLNPRKAYTRISTKAKFVFVGNTSVAYEDKNPGVIERSSKWWDMPPGEYLVYPIEDEYLDFTWWHKDS